MARRNPQPTVLPKPMPAPGRRGAPQADEEDVEFASWLGERARRVALGLAAALIAARAYWPGEVDVKAEGGDGLGWDLLVLITAGLALASALIGGRLRVRWSWADAAVIALMFLVGLSSVQAVGRRLAINLAWDWAAIGLLYVMVRNLPRTVGESKALVGALLATAVALSVYGLYQMGVEMPLLRARFEANPLPILKIQEIPPDSPAALLFAKRLRDSIEPMSTFALTNSLAGYLVGPFVVMLALGWENWLRRDGRGSRLASLALAGVPALAVGACLLFTKSRSAYAGLAVAVAILAFRERRRVPPRTLVRAGLAGSVVVAAFVAVALMFGLVDRMIVEQATLSMRYRWEYWVGAWRVITENAHAFWVGHGPGNFTAGYLRYKLPQASEEIFDPHNMILEVWATAGTPAMIALVAALALGVFELLGTPTRKGSIPGDESEDAPRSRRDVSDPPPRAGWLLASAGGGLLVVLLLGRIDLFDPRAAEGNLARWFVLTGSWLGAILFGWPLWRRLPLAVSGLGAGVVATAVNLLAAGGIGITPVALMLWMLVALGLNLREDRDCGRLRDAGGRLPAFGLALVWAALLGSFYGAILPFWRSEAALADGEIALNARPPQFEKAEAAYIRACESDVYSSRPWFGLAFEKFREWQSRGAKVDDLRWKTIPVIMADAVKPPRNPDSWTMHRERAFITGRLIAQLGANLKPGELTKYRADVVHATRTASGLYPSNATLHAELAVASAEIGMFGDAEQEAREALRLDGLTPHDDKKLATPLRERLKAELPNWEKAAKGGIPAGVLPRP